MDELSNRLLIFAVLVAMAFIFLRTDLVTTMVILLAGICFPTTAAKEIIKEKLPPIPELSLFAKATRDKPGKD